MVNWAQSTNRLYCVVLLYCIIIVLDCIVLYLARLIETYVVNWAQSTNQLYCVVLYCIIIVFDILCWIVLSCI